MLHGSPEVRVTVQDGDWRAALTQVFALCRADHPRQRLDVRCELGADHARVALMTVDRDHGLTSVSATKQESFVNAWAAEMLHVTAQEQIVRWRALADPRRVLVSCVSRAVVEQLQRACGEAGARLVSCRPALLGAVDAVPRLERNPQAKDLTVIWTEDGAASARHDVVQLLRFSDQHLTAAWRGWVPVNDEQAEEALQALVTRFESAGDGALGARASMHWPAPAAAAAAVE